MRVLAALSGGVDSAVAAARAADAGHDVVAVHMALTRERARASGLVSAYTTWHLERRLLSLTLVERA